jgi:hypothetical protein
MLLLSVIVWDARFKVKSSNVRVEELLCDMLIFEPMEPVPPTLMDDVDEPTKLLVPLIDPFIPSVVPFKVSAPDVNVSVPATVNA